MIQSFSHLVWLGAGSATEPADLVTRAKQATLFEAREGACQMLRGKFDNVTVHQQVITHDGSNVNFREYNLAEFSATKEATGLKKLFPGLKEKSVDQISSWAIGDAIAALQLKDNNNLLVIDIADSNLTLLKALEQKKLLCNFSEIQIQSSSEQLYTDAATTKEITAFLQIHGYVLQQTHSQDPDLPWHSFGLNPLWQTLKITEQKLQSAQNELAADRQKLDAAQKVLESEKQKSEGANSASTIGLQKFEAAHKELVTVRQKFAELEQQLDAAHKAKQGIEQQLAAAKAEKEAILKLQKENITKFSGDAQIDEVISDLSAFFTGKFITYVDVGAFTGEILEKIVASKKITVREAHLYEPNPESFKMLKEKFAETRIKSFHANNFAIGDSEKNVTLMPAQSMTKIISSGDISGDGQDIFVSNVKTLDAEISRITDKHIHLLKVDVEGYEMEVLRGSEQTLKNQLVDVIYIEVGFNKNGTQQTYMADIDNYLQDVGYRVFKIYEQKNEWIDDSPLLRRCNFAYMSTSFAKANPFKLTMTIAELKQELTKLQTTNKNSPN